MKTSAANKMILRLIRASGWIYAVHTFFWVLNMLLPLLPGLVVRRLLDLLTNDGGGQLWPLIAVFLGIAVGRAALVLVAAPVDIYRAFLTVSILWRNMLGTILQLPGARALPCSPGEAISRYRDDAYEVEDFLSNVPDITGAAISVLVAVAILARIDAPLALAVCVPVVFITSIAHAGGYRLAHYRRNAREAAARATGLISESFGSVLTVKAACVEDAFRKRLDALNAERARAVLRDRFFTLLLESVESGAAGLGTGIVLLLAANSVSHGRLSVGDLSLFASYLTTVADRGVYFGSWLARYRQSLVGFERMQALMAGAPEEQLTSVCPLYFAGTPGAEETGAGLGDALTVDLPAFESLRIEALTCSAGEAGSGVVDVDLEVLRGETVVVSGRVGSGKTTLLRAVLGLLPLESGEVIWNGVPVRPPVSDLRPPKAAYVPQAPVLFSDTIGRNVMLSHGGDEREALPYLHIAEFDEDLAEMEEGVSTSVGTRGARLSGGQIQRVAFARALAQNPRLLVLDDLSSALDGETEGRLLDRLAAFDDQACLIVSTRRAVLSRATRVVLLKDGRVLDQGPLPALLERCEEMRLIWEGKTGEAV